MTVLSEDNYLFVNYTYSSLLLISWDINPEVTKALPSFLTSFADAKLYSDIAVGQVSQQNKRMAS